jgi:chemotaxis protein methyltransferase CheR
MTALAVQNVDLTEKDFHKISDIVYEHCGINLYKDKKELIRARVVKRLRLGNFKTFSEYIKYVLEDKTGKEFSLLIDSLSTNLTGFFREPQHFDFVRTEFLPPVLERKKKKRNFKIRTWSAGCSSGEEAYSLAMILLEATQGTNQWNVKVFANDISTTMLETARKGIYEKERVEPIPSLLKQKYMIHHRKESHKVFEVSQILRDTVTFKHMNLVKRWGISETLDFIFCRNVMIYFDKHTRAHLVNCFYDLLNPGGVLFTGHSESLIGIDHKFDYVQPTIYLRP